MSVGAVSENPYAYMDRLMEGGATIHNNTTARSVADDTATKTAATTPQKSDAAEEDSNLFGEDGFGFDDFLDIINPLQHIPFISTLYREITGDELAPGARIIGGGLFGGGIGLATSVINSVVETQTGKDIGEHVVSLFSGDEATDDSAIAAAPQKTANVVADMESDLQAASVPVSQAAIPITAPQPQIQSQQKGLISPTPANETVTDKTVSTGAAVTAEPQTSASASQLAMGLEWKNQPPNMLKNIEKIRTSQGDNLSSDQLARLLGSFNQAAFEGSAKPAVKNNAPKNDNAKPDHVSDITPVTRAQVHQTYGRGSEIAAIPKPVDFMQYDGPTR